MKDVRDKEITTRVVVLGGLCLLAVICNLLAPLLFDDVQYQSVGWHLGFLAAGCLVAEVCLLAIWCGLSLQAIKYRLPITVSLVLVAACSYTVGLQLMDHGMPLVIALTIFGAAFGGFAVLQLPLWLVRRYSPCRITTAEQAAQAEPLRGAQFSVGYLLLWTALVGLLLVVVRNSLPDGREEFSAREIIQITIFLLSYAGFSSLLCIPCVWVVLGKRNELPASLLCHGALKTGHVGAR